jgi:hypothetical protein
VTVHRPQVPQVPQVPQLFLASPPSKPNVCLQTCETSYTVVMSGFLLCRVDAGHGDDHDDPVDGRWGPDHQAAPGTDAMTRTPAAELAADLAVSL